MPQLPELEDRVNDLENQLQQKTAELDDIASMGVMLTSMLDVDAILSAMMEMSLRLVSAEVGCILLAEDGHLVTKVSWGVDASLIRKIKLEDNIDVAEWTHRVGETTVINEFPADDEAKAVISSIILVPLSHQNKQIGVIVAVNKTGVEYGFEESDRLTLERLSNFASVAIENARLMKELLAKQKLEQELSLAKEIQRALLPNFDVEFEGAHLETLYIPAGKVGGDYVDVIPISDSEFVLIVGDVSNKGIPAALMMTAARSAIRAEASRGGDVAEIVTHINNVLSQDVMKYPDIFISFVFAHFDLAKKTCTYTNAGHLPPFKMNEFSGKMEELKTGGIIVGQFEEFDYKSDTVSLEAGDKLLFFTDGVTECVNLDNEMYGRQRLGEFLVSLAEVSAREFIYKLKMELESFVYGTGEIQFDDITAVLVQIGGECDG